MHLTENVCMIPQNLSREFSPPSVGKCNGFVKRSACLLSCAKGYSGTTTLFCPTNASEFVVSGCFGIISFLIVFFGLFCGVVSHIFFDIHQQTIARSVKRFPPVTKRMDFDAKGLPSLSLIALAFPVRQDSTALPTSRVTQTTATSSTEAALVFVAFFLRLSRVLCVDLLPSAFVFPENACQLPNPMPRPYMLPSNGKSCTGLVKASLCKGLKCTKEFSGKPVPFCGEDGDIFDLKGCYRIWWLCFFLSLSFALSLSLSLSLSD